MPSRNETIASEIVGVLVPYVVERRREMTYGELSRGIAERYGDNVPAWHAMAGPLGLIQEACKSLSLPNLPVMVVDQKTLRPAKGWYDEFDQLYPDLAGLDEVEKRVKARSDVLACADWGPLLERYGHDSQLALPSMLGEPAFGTYVEGARIASFRLREESKRNPIARQKCLEAKGAKCVICGFDSAERYGIPGIIDVHHLHPLSDGNERETDPETDLVPVCPNCHRIIHSREGNPYDPDEVAAMLAGTEGNTTGPRPEE